MDREQASNLNSDRSVGAGAEHRIKESGRLGKGNRGGEKGGAARASEVAPLKLRPVWGRAELAPPRQIFGFRNFQFTVGTG